MEKVGWRLNAKCNGTGTFFVRYCMSIMQTHYVDMGEFDCSNSQIPLFGDQEVIIRECRQQD